MAESLSRSCNGRAWRDLAVRTASAHGIAMVAEEIVTCRRNECCNGAREIVIRVLVATAVVHSPSVSSASDEIVVVVGGFKI
ncbi:hypothetical protein TIFTF001_008620 [Ficus carica]|uniref:Uncharacterized protein n=1 Tax=Ficus carica TaxID=3494 RepID=A0AA88CY59_FICCA|nr:hypothetical protein TIFTF001_008620 [Ficus carica]